MSDGGAGGGGAAGGAGSAGANGSDAIAAVDGGGGGASGASGGAGGASGASVGGAGGTAGSLNGQNGASDSTGNNGGGGGGGGAHGVIPTTLSNAGDLSGGTGGNGGDVNVSNPTSVVTVGGGGGGAGGYGALISGTTNSNSGSITGGNGGRGGQAILNSFNQSNGNAVSAFTAEGGIGGSAGSGVALSSAGASLSNTANASIGGGQGGDSTGQAQFYNYASNTTTAKSALVVTTAASGAGGAGAEFLGANGSMTNLGGVSGGASGNASAQSRLYLRVVDGYVASAAGTASSAAAGAGVHFTGANSTLTNGATGTIVGGYAGDANALGDLDVNSNTSVQPTGQSSASAMAKGGRGGDGVRFDAAGAAVTNAGSFTGGDGGLAIAVAYRYSGGSGVSSSVNASGGNGGDGLHFAADATVVNSGTITGGAAGAARGSFYTSDSMPASNTPVTNVYSTVAGNGGNGIDIASGNVTNQTAGTIVGGASVGYFSSQVSASALDAKAVISGGAAGAGIAMAAGSVTNAGAVVGGAAQQYFRSNQAFNSGDVQSVNGATVARAMTYVASSAAGGAGIRMADGAVLNQASGSILGGDVTNDASIDAQSSLYVSSGVNDLSGISGTYTINATVNGGSAGRGVEISGAGALRNEGAVKGGGAGSQFTSRTQVGSYTYGSGSNNSMVGVLTNATTAGAGGDGVAAGGTSTVVNAGTISGGDSANTVQGRARVVLYSSGAVAGTNNTVRASGTTTITGGAGGSAVVLADNALLTNLGTLTGGNSSDSFALDMSTSRQQYNGGSVSGLSSTLAVALQAGAGGAGALLSGGTLKNSGTVTGGNGGNVDLTGSSAQDNIGGALFLSANAGAGGAGVQFTGTGNASVYNALGGTLQGGNGGVVSHAATGNVAATGLLAGAGGAGVSGANVTVTNAGTIQGGLGGDGVRAAPIVFTGGVNKLTIEATSNILGNVQAFSGADTFGLGGTTDASFNVGQIGDSAQYRGFGNFEKTGTSKWTLTGSSTQQVAFVVRQGRLANNASLPGTMVTVASGGTLAGNGTLGGITAQAGSIVAPGNSIGTLNINGNYSAAAGSIYQVEYDGTTSDLINATGTATIASGAGLQAIHYATAPVPLNVRYTVVYAAGGVTGKYTLSGETVASPFVTLHDTYDANHVYLEATQIAPLVPTTPGLALKSGYTVNQINTGGSAQRLAITNGLRQALLYQPTVATALAAFDQISGESHASVKTVLLEDSRFVREAANDRLLGAFCAPGAATLAGAATAPSADCAPATGNVTWGKIFGSTGHIKGDGNAQQADRDIGGVMVGADTSVGNGWRVGGLAGYSRSNMDNVRSSSVKTDDYTLGAYGGNQWDQTSLRLGASYTWHKLDTQRTVAFSGFADSLSAKYDASTSQVFGELGQRMDLGALALEPFAGLAYVSVKTDAFGERGGLSALHGSGDAIDASFETLGVRASANVSDATQLRGMLGWRRAFSAVTPSSTHAFAGGTAFTVYGVPIARDVAVIEAGLETVLRPDLTLGASYSGQFGSGLKDNGFKVTLGLKF